MNSSTPTWNIAAPQCYCGASLCPLLCRCPVASRMICMVQPRSCVAREPEFGCRSDNKSARSAWSMVTLRVGLCIAHQIRDCGSPQHLHQAELLQDLSSLDVDLRARVTLNVHNQRKSIRCMAAYFHTSIKQLIGKTEKLMGHIHVLWHGHCYVVKCLHSQGVRHTTRRNHRHPTQGRDFQMWHVKCHSVSAPIESIRGEWPQCVHPHG